MLIFSTVIWINADPTRRLKIRAQTTLHTHYRTMTELRRQTESWERIGTGNHMWLLEANCSLQDLKQRIITWQCNPKENPKLKHLNTVGRCLQQHCLQQSNLKNTGLLVDGCTRWCYCFKKCIILCMCVGVGHMRRTWTHQRTTLWVGFSFPTFTRVSETQVVRHFIWLSHLFGSRIFPVYLVFRDKVSQ